MSEPGDKTKDISDIQPDRLIKYRVSDDRFSAEVLLPGLWYTDFDKKIGGKLTFWALGKIFESGRYTVLPKGLLYYDKITEMGNTIFMAGCAYKMTPEFSKISSDKDWGKNFPLHISFKLTDVGSSSFSFECKLTDYVKGTLLATFLAKFVMVGFQTRKPAPLPDYFRGQQLNIKDRKTITRQWKIPIPPNAYQYFTKAAFSDTDHNLHVNSSTYLRWCTDAGARAAAVGCYRNFNESLESYPNAEIELQYVGESMANDEFVVCTWEDPIQPRCVRFVITKAGKPVVLCRFIYHEQISSHHSKL